MVTLLQSTTLALDQSALFSLSQTGETGDGMDLPFLYHGEESPSSGIIPTDEREIGTARIANGVAREGRVGNKPSFVDSRRCERRLLEVVIASFHVQRILHVGLAARIVMELRFDADALTLLFCEDIDFVRHAAAHERDFCFRAPSVGSHTSARNDSKGYPEGPSWKTARLTE